MYTRKFRATDPREAIQYFYFLRDLKGVRGENLFMASVSELALETREFDMLLGRLEVDGCRSPGLIDKFQGETGALIELVASDCETKGLCEDAVKLYDLAGKKDKVLELLVRMLSQVVTQPNTPQSRRDLLQSLALGIADRYKTQGVGGDRDVSGTFYLLLDIMTFFDQFHAKNYQDALDVIQRLRLVPLQADDVEQKVSTFRHLSEEVRRCLPDILLAIMSILFSQYKNSKTSVQSPVIGGMRQSFDDGGKEKFISYVRKQARALITFAGMIPYRMPGDTNARLVQMEVLMN
jgi:nuclear pore complex protein Nup93